MKTFIRSLILFAVLFRFATVMSGQRVIALEKVSMTVADLERAVNFYTGVLNFQLLDTGQLAGPVAGQLFGLQEPALRLRTATLQLGGQTIELMAFSNMAPGRPIPPDSRSNDLWFQHIAIVVSDMDEAYQQLLQRGVTHVSTAPQTLPRHLPAAAGISAFYFRDPDGHNLELIHFPRKKGDPKWREQVKDRKKDSPAPLFLGIDHTAIGIDQTNEGYLFWRDLLGLQVAGHSENYGTEQEHLNQVFGARLIITGLRAQHGFGLEFLDYLAPPGGRPYPPDSRPTDLWHWHTTVRVSGLKALYERLQAQGHTVISHGIVTLQAGSHALLVRDRDGHAVLLLEEAPTTTSSR